MSASPPASVDDGGGGAAPPAKGAGDGGATAAAPAWRAASLCWVKQSRFPWWPAMVTYEPSSGAYSKGKDPSAPPTQYHVQFFGDSPLRAWVSAKTGMRAWEGPQGAGDDLRTAQKIPKKYLADWPVALEQAETAFGINNMQRLQMFGCDFRPDTGAGAAAADPAEDTSLGGYSSDDSSDDEPEQIWVQPDDPNKPKRAMTAYFCFTSERRAQIAAERPELASNVTLMAKTLGKEWKELDEEARKPFAALAEKDKERYQKEMKDYKPLDKILVTNPSKLQKKKAAKAARKKRKDKNAPKKAMGSYMYFTQAMRPKLLEENPELGLTGVAQRCGALWKELSEEDKAPYIELAATDKERYAKEMETYVPPPELAMPVEKKVSKRDQARKEKEKKERKRKRAVEQEKAERKDAVSKAWAAILELEVEGRQWTETIRGHIASDYRKEIGITAIEEKLRKWNEPPPAEEMATTGQPSPKAAKSLPGPPPGRAAAASPAAPAADAAASAATAAEVGADPSPAVPMETEPSAATETEPSGTDSSAGAEAGTDPSPEVAMETESKPTEEAAQASGEAGAEAAGASPQAGTGSSAEAGAAAAAAETAAASSPAAESEPSQSPKAKSPKAKEEYSPAQFCKDVELMVSVLQTKAEGTAAAKMPGALSLACKEILAGLKTKKTRKSKVEMANEQWCAMCEEGGVLICCEGGCMRSFHPACLGLACVPKGKFECDSCQTGNETCFVCGGTAKTVDMLKCEHPGCGKYYHKRCKKELPRMRPEEHGVSTTTGFICPRHICANSGLPGTEKWPLLRCTRCPIAYHQAFIPAGCTMRGEEGSAYFTCQRHADPGKHPNCNNCMVCDQAGELICCDTCPGTYHSECISGKQGYIKPPEGDAKWSCPDCVNGTKPVVDDIIWGKVGNYRWWPAQVRYRHDLPEKLQKKEPKPGEFAVYYFGTGEFGYLSHACSVGWESGDEKRRFSLGTKKKNFSEAVEQALVAYNERCVQREKEREELIETVTIKPMSFKKISKNAKHPSYVEDKAWIKKERAELSECVCDPAVGCGEDCLNRSMMTECDPNTCPCGKKTDCGNRRIQKRQTPKGIQSYKTADKGFGLRCKQDLTPGDLVTEYCGQVISPEECSKRLQEQGAQGIGAFYMVSIDAEQIIDAGPMGNLARFANHDCDPNMILQKWNVNGQMRVGLFACKDVPAGEELTWNYNLDSFEGHKKLKCFCGAANCSGWIGMKKAQNSDADAKSPEASKTKDKPKSRQPKLWPGGRQPTHLKPQLPKDLPADTRAALRKLGKRPCSQEAEPALRKLMAATKRKAAYSKTKASKKSKENPVDDALKSDEEEVEEWVVPKDPNRPKRGLSAFFFFTKDFRAKMQPAAGAAAAAEPEEYTAKNNEQPKAIAAKLGISVSDLVRLNVETYPGLKGTSRLQDGTVLQLPRAAEAPESSDASPTKLGQGEMAKLAGKAWKELGEEGQAPYVALSEQDRARYQKDMETYVPPAKVRVVTRRKKKAPSPEEAGAAAAAPEAVKPPPKAENSFSIWGKGRTELGPASDEEEEADAEKAPEEEGSPKEKPAKTKRVARYLRQTGPVEEAAESSEEEEGDIQHGAAQPAAPVRNVWAAKAQTAKAAKAKTKGKGKAKAKGAKGKAKGVKRAKAGGAAAAPKAAKRAATDRTSPVFSETATATTEAATAAAAATATTTETSPTV